MAKIANSWFHLYWDSEISKATIDVCIIIESCITWGFSQHMIFSPYLLYILLQSAKQVLARTLYFHITVLSAASPMYNNILIYYVWLSQAGEKKIVLRLDLKAIWIGLCVATANWYGVELSANFKQCCCSCHTLLRKTSNELSTKLSCDKDWNYRMKPF